MGDQTPDANVTTYGERMAQTNLQRERDNTMKNIADKKKAQEEAAAEQLERARPTKASGIQPVLPPPEASAGRLGDKRRNRWDQGTSGDA